MSRIVLDTSAYSHFKRGDAKVVDIIDSADWVGIPAVVLGELLAGFKMGQRVRENERELQEFLAHPAVEELSVDRHVAAVYAEIVIALRRAGTPLPVNAIWIAASAAAAGASVLTYDAHFEKISRVGSIVVRR